MLADVLGLVGSSPTPGASDVGSKAKNIYLKSEIIPEKIFYKEKQEEDLTDEEITSLNVQSAVIKVGRITWSPGEVISPKQFMKDLDLSYEEVNDFFANILASRNKSA